MKRSDLNCKHFLCFKESSEHTWLLGTDTMFSIIYYSIMILPLTMAEQDKGGNKYLTPPPPMF